MSEDGKRQGFHCWWTGCTRTVNDGPLYRTRPKGLPGNFMCEPHAALMNGA